MDQTTTFAVTGGSGVVIAYVLQLVKALIERRVPPEDSLHDPTIQLSAGVIGLLGFVLHQWALGPWVAPAIWSAGAQGVLAGLTAVGSYHILTASKKARTAPRPTPAQGVLPASRAWVPLPPAALDTSRPKDDTPAELFASADGSPHPSVRPQLNSPVPTAVVP